MENKTSKKLTGMKLTFVILFFIMICLPLSMMAVFGPDEYDQDVFQETETKLVPLNWESYKSGSFHSSFESWFSRYYPLRSEIVRLYNGVKHTVENLPPASATMTFLSGFGSVYRPAGATLPPNGNISEEYMELYLNPDNKYAAINSRRLSIIPEEPTGFKGTTRVYIGKSSYLFESTYIDEYLGFAEPYTTATEEGIKTTVEKLEYIQTELKERYGITMIFVLTPNKAAHCSEYIPDYYINRFTPAENYIRPVDIMRKYLAESNVNYLDSTAYYQDIGLVAVFPQTGTHWNHVASAETTFELIRMYTDISGNSAKLPTVTDVLVSPNPIQTGNSDTDIFNLLYGAMGDVPGKTLDDEYYSPIVSIENKDAPKLNVFIQGGSFAIDIEYYLEAHRVADVRRIYYNGAYNVDKWDENADPWTTGIYAWESILPEYELIIFEMNEQQVRGGHITDGNWSAQSDGNIGSNAVYDSLYEYLKATEN